MQFINWGHSLQILHINPKIFGIGLIGTTCMQFHKRAILCKVYTSKKGIVSKMVESNRCHQQHVFDQTLSIDSSFFNAIQHNTSDPSFHLISQSLYTKHQVQQHRRSRASLYLCAIWSRFPIKCLP